MHKYVARKSLVILIQLFVMKDENPILFVRSVWLLIHMMYILYTSESIFKIRYLRSIDNICAMFSNKFKPKPIPDSILNTL